MLRGFWLFAVICLAVGLMVAGSAAEQPSAAPEPEKTEKTEEEKLGERAAAELEKTLKPLPDHPELARLERIANGISSHTERPEVRYSVKVVASRGINAVSLPGGRLYVTEGVLAAAESEDELAAILAHEIAHNSLGHALRQRERASRTDLGVIAGVLAGIVYNRGEIAIMAAQIQQGALNHYGRKAEMEADRHALTYLSKTQYKPTALLTVMEGLAAIEESRWRPPVITTAETHPLARERVREIEDLLRKMDINITAERRQVTDRFRVEVKSTEKDGHSIAEITLNGKSLFSPAATEESATPLERAQTYADSIRKALKQGIQMIDLKITDLEGASLVQARGETLIKATAEDASFHKRSARELAEEAKKALELALYAERVSRPF